MSDRLAVFNHGRIEQLGTPSEVYERPTSEFVAGFVGVSNIVERDGKRLVVRPERIRMNGAGEPGTIAEVVYVGAFMRYLVDLDAGERLTVVRQNVGSPTPTGTRVGLAWSPEDTFPLPPPQTQEER
jgi:putative spermidine/putrescine transport system ATP-binding protein